LSAARFNINLLEELTLGNFKCFSTPQKLPLRPITLLYGPNGAGKSSVIQALNWLPSLATGAWPQEFPRYVRNYNEQSDLTIGAKVSPSRETVTRTDSDPFVLRMQHWIRDRISAFAFEAELTGKDPLQEFIATHQDYAPYVQGWTKLPLVSRATVLINDTPFLELGRWSGQADLRTKIFEQNARLQVTKFNKDNPIVPLLLPLLKDLGLHRIKSRNALSDFLDPVLSRWQTAVEQFDLEAITFDQLPDLEDQIFFDAYKLPIRAELSERDQDAVYVSSGQSGGPTIMAPYLEMFPNPNWGDVSNVREYLLDQFRLLVSLLVNFLSDLDELTFGLSSPFWNIVHIGALRSIPTGEFLLTHSHDQSRWAPDWHLAAGPSAIQRQIGNVNAWLESLGRRDTAYRFVASQLETQESFEGGAATREQHLRFKGILDLRRNVLVPLRDTGTGFSQLLPIILAAFAGNGELVAVQQPELHLHPALQSELADLFITRALGERFDEAKWDGTNQFVLETHSEHLLLRIMRRIRETSRGSLPNHIPPVYPDDVSVLYIDNVGDDTIVRPMPFSNDGQLLYDWPGGFFEEGLREVLM
jgi:hypothetical protein